jgi:hypothetical protein
MVKDSGTAIRHTSLMLDDEVIQRIESFPFRRAPVAAERRNKGYTLLHAETGAPIARLRPIGRDDQMEILYWSSWKQHWVPVDPLGALWLRPTKPCASLPLNLSSGRATKPQPPKMGKVELSSTLAIFKGSDTRNVRKNGSFYNFLMVPD